MSYCSRTESQYFLSIRRCQLTRTFMGDKLIVFPIPCHLGLAGATSNFIPASSGVLLAFLLLQGIQDRAVFSQLALPPRDFGTTWSKFNSAVGN